MLGATSARSRPSEVALPHLPRLPHHDQRGSPRSRTGPTATWMDNGGDPWCCVARGVSGDRCRKEARVTKRDRAELAALLRGILSEVPCRACHGNGIPESASSAPTPTTEDGGSSWLEQMA